jgi:hypothetical protein
MASDHGARQEIQRWNKTRGTVAPPMAVASVRMASSNAIRKSFRRGYAYRARSPLMAEAAAQIVRHRAPLARGLA